MHAPSAADDFVMSTRNEGWANVLQVAMGCGVPVVGLDVGVNTETVPGLELGITVPFSHRRAPGEALHRPLRTDLGREGLLAHASVDNWNGRVEMRAFEFPCPWWRTVQ